jgi:outer membrane protein OmpA-like peptidoglycan-associated protein
MIRGKGVRAPAALAAAAVLVVLAGCAGAPVANNASLEDARASYRAVSADPQAQLRAPVELAVAERTLAEAERLWRANAPADLVAHQSYLATQRSRIALTTAQYRKAESAVATSGEQRNSILLRAREQEAESAKSQARAAEQARAEDEIRAEQVARTTQAQAAKSPDLGSELARLKAQISGLKAEQTERGWVLTLRNDVLFDSGSATLKPGARRALDNLAQFMNRYPDREIAIEGFTDSVGAHDANRRLSENRAAAVKNALVARGIEPSRIDARGYGPAFPVASNETPTGRQLNRRVEIVIDPS